MTDATKTKRLEALRAVLADAHQVLGLKFGFELWDGSTVPADLPPGSMRLAFRDDGVVTTLLRKPTFDTLVNAHVAGRIDLLDGSLFDLAASRPSGKAGRLLRRLSKIKLMRAGWHFLRGPKGDPTAGSLADVREQADARSGEAAVNKRISPTTTTFRTRSTRSFSIPRWSTPAPIFSRLARRPRPRAARQARHDLPQATAEARRSLSRYRLRLGGARLPRRATLWRHARIGVTLSEEQARWRGRRSHARPADRVTIVLQDYRCSRATSTRSPRSACSSMSASATTRPISPR